VAFDDEGLRESKVFSKIGCGLKPGRQLFSAESGNKLTTGRLSRDQLGGTFMAGVLISTGIIRLAYLFSIENPSSNFPDKGLLNHEGSSKCLFHYCGPSYISPL